ncbi:MAG: PmoA family protein [Bryobacteraceae bacterium]|jgi:hypothetical protein
MNKRFLLSCFAASLWGQVAFDVKGDRVVIQVDKRLFATLYQGKEAHKPFLHPLLTPSGKAVTRGFPVDPQPGDPTDHPHQRGLWVGAEKLSGMDFWENDPSYKRPQMGRIEWQELTAAVDGDRKGTLSFVANWISEEGSVVVVERRRMIFYSEPANCRMFDVELELEARRRIVFEDQDDALIGMRLNPSFDQRRGGRLVNAEGLAGEEGVRGQRSAWIDWTADLDGEKIGVAVFDHPANFNHPTRWHVRSFGFLDANPFAQRAFDKAAPDGSHPLEKGEKLRMRYRILIHPAGADLKQFYKEFEKEQAQ